MRWLLWSLVVLVLAACEVAPTPPAPPGPPAASEQPQLPAADPTETGPSLAAFRTAAISACSAAQDAIRREPLRGDPLRDGASRRDISAAVSHYTIAAGVWSEAANVLFEFGLPDNPAGQSFIGALDTLALRFEQAAEALASGDAVQAQGAIAFAQEAHTTTDQIGRELGVGPLDACGRKPPADTDKRLKVQASDFGFALTPPGRGRTRVVLRNTGEEAHHVFVVRLREPGTLDEALRADREGADPGPWLADEGKVSTTIPPGERTAINVRFRSGTYAFLCFVASPDGTPHAFKGMAAEVIVGA